MFGRAFRVEPLPSPGKGQGGKGGQSRLLDLLFHLGNLESVLLPKPRSVDELFRGAVDCHRQCCVYLPCCQI